MSTLKHEVGSADAATLLPDPERVATLPSEQIPAVLCRLSGLQTALAARLAETAQHPAGAPPSGDELLDVRGAARRLGVSTDWLYRHAKGLPFTVRVSPRQLRFSAQGITQYIRQRRGR